jgi:hypothetical protein
MPLFGRGCGRRRHVDDYAATDSRLRPRQSRCDVVLEPGAGQAGRHVDDVGVHDALLRSERRLPCSTMLSIRSVPILAAELAADYSRHRPRLTKFRSYLASTRRSKQTSWRGAKVLGGRLSDKAGRRPQCFPAEFRQVARVVDEHRRFDADAGEALFPLLGQRFHGLAEVGERVARGEATADSTISMSSGSRWTAASSARRACSSPARGRPSGLNPCP